MGLDMFDSFPEDMLKYLQNYGFHFNKKACEFALNKMKIRQSEQIQKSQVDNMMSKYNINSDQDVLYDAVFVSNLAKSKLGFSLQEEQKLIQFVKAYLECGNVFCKWNATLVHKGVPIEWSDLL